MREVLLFCKENWKLILEISLFLFSVVILIIKKKPVKVVDTLKETIVRILPALINLAEIQVGYSGENKKEFVLEKLREALHELNFGDDLITQYLPFASEQVEIILSTPQKKGGLNCEKRIKKS